MLDFLARYVFLSVVVVSLGLGGAYLLTYKRPKLRQWFLAKPDRIAYVGISLLLLLWLAVAGFNQINRAEIRPNTAFERDAPKAARPSI